MYNTLKNIAYAFMSSSAGARKLVAVDVALDGEGMSNAQIGFHMAAYSVCT